MNGDISIFNEPNPVQIMTTFMNLKKNENWIYDIVSSAVVCYCIKALQADV